MQRTELFRYPTPCAGCNGYVAFDDVERSRVEADVDRVYHSDCYERKLLANVQALSTMTRSDRGTTPGTRAPQPVDPRTFLTLPSPQRVNFTRAESWGPRSGAWNVSDDCG